MSAAGNESVRQRIEINLTRLKNSGFGFTIRGGTDKPLYNDDSDIFVTVVDPHGAAAIDGRLRPGDKIIQVNGESLVNLTHEEAVKRFKACGECVTITVLPKNPDLHNRCNLKDSSEKIISDAGDYSGHFGRNLILPTVLGALLIGLISAFLVKKNQSRV